MRIDQDDRLADAGWVTFRFEERRGFVGVVRPDQSGSEELHHEGEGRSLGLSDWDHCAGQSSFRIRCRPPLAVQSPAFRYRLALLAGSHNLAAGNPRQGKIYDQRILISQRCGEGDRICPEQRRPAAPRGHRAGCIGQHQSNKTGVCEPFNDHTHDTAMVRAANARQGNTLACRHRSELFDGQVNRRIGKSIGRINRHESGCRLRSFGHGETVDLAGSGLGTIGRDPSQPVAALAESLCPGQRVSDGYGVLLARS